MCRPDTAYQIILKSVDATPPVKLRQQDVDIFDYGGEFKPQPLYMKSSYITPDHINYDKQKYFDDKLRQLNELDLRGFGPSLEELKNLLRNNGLTIKGYKLLAEKQ